MRRINISPLKLFIIYIGTSIYIFWSIIEPKVYVSNIYNFIQPGLCNGFERHWKGGYVAGHDVYLGISRVLNFDSFLFYFHWTFIWINLSLPLLISHFENCHTAECTLVQSEFSILHFFLPELAIFLTYHFICDNFMLFNICSNTDWSLSWWSR